MRHLVASVVLFCALPLLADTAKETTYDRQLAVFDERITAELKALSPAAVPIFAEGTKELRAGNDAAATKHYARVVELAPTFSHAWRRQAQAELSLGNRKNALVLQRKALELEPSTENHASLASVLLSTEKPTKKEKAEAAKAAKAATRDVRALDVPSLVQLGQIALQLEDAALLDTITQRLLVTAADESATYYLHALSLGMRGELSAGRDALDRARELGLDTAVYEELSDAFDEARPLWLKLAIWSAWIGIPWVVGLLLLYVAGISLGRAALKASQELPSNRSGEATSFGSRLRRTYSAVITAAAAYYYISVPIVAFLTLAVAGVFILGLMALGWLPIKLLLIAVILGGVSVIGLVRGMFVKHVDEDPGAKLDLSANPAFRKVLDDVAAAIGTRPVDNVYLTPGTDVAVMERTKRGSDPERCLILGAGVIEGYELQSFKAVLGHEYGHLTNRDTAGGQVALAVRNRIAKTAAHVAEGGAAVWYNPAWLFLTGFHRLFLRISHGASRFQEAMADRWAAFAYGSESFEKGLRHAIAQAVLFDAKVGASIKDVVDNQRSMRNLYMLTAQREADAEVQQQVDEELARETSAHDSHPSFRDRIAWVNALNARGTEAAEEDGRDVWSLFADPQAIQEQMTGVVRENLRANYGVEIAEEEAAAASA